MIVGSWNFAALWYWIIGGLLIYLMPYCVISGFYGVGEMWICIKRVYFLAYIPQLIKHICTWASVAYDWPAKDFLKGSSWISMTLFACANICLYMYGSRCRKYEFLFQTFAMSTMSPIIAFFVINTFIIPMWPSLCSDLMRIIFRIVLWPIVVEICVVVARAPLRVLPRSHSSAREQIFVVSPTVIGLQFFGRFLVSSLSSVRMVIGLNLIL